MLDPASRKLLEFGLIGLVIAGALVSGLEYKPATIFPSNGTFILEITDGQPGILRGMPCEDCAILSLNVTIDSVKVQRIGVLTAAGETIEVLRTTTTLDLLRVRNSTRVLGSMSLHEGQITLVQLHLVGAMAKVVGKSEVVASGELKVNLRFFATVRGGLTTVVVIDFQPHVVCQGNGDCRFTPVVTLKEVRGPR